MAKHGYENIYKKVEEGVKKAATEAVKNAIAEVEKKEVTVNPNVKVNETKITQDVSKQVDRAISEVKASKKISVDDLIDLNPKQLKKSLKAVRAELEEASETGNVKSAKNYAREALRIAKVAESGGVNKIPTHSKGTKDALEIKDFISSLVEDYNISQKEIQAINSAINQSFQESIRETEQGVEQYKKVVESAKTKMKSVKAEMSKIDTTSKTTAATDKTVEDMKKVTEEANKAGEAIKKATEQPITTTNAVSEIKKEAQAQAEVNEKLKEYYQLRKVNTKGENVRSIDKQFASEQEAFNYLYDVEHVKNKRFWKVDKIETSPSSIEAEIKANKENELAIKGVAKAKAESAKTVDNSKAVEQTKAEADSHKENEKAIKAETQAKTESKQTADTTTTVETVKAETEARKANETAIKAETQAKEESKVTNQQQAQLEALQRVRDERKAAYDEAFAQLDSLENKHRELTAELGKEPELKRGYFGAYKNAQRDNFLLDKEGNQHFTNQAEALLYFANEKATEYATTGEYVKLGKAAGYYEQYVKSLQGTEAEIQKVTVAGQDMTQVLLDASNTVKNNNFRDNKTIVNEANGFVPTIVALRENVSNLKQQYDSASDSAKNFADNINKATVVVKEPEIQFSSDSMDALNDLLGSMNMSGVDEFANAEERVKEKVEETTDAVKKQKDVLSSSTESSTQKETENLKAQEEAAKATADAESKLAEKKKEGAEASRVAAEAAKEEKTASDTTEEVANTEKATRSKKAKAEASKEAKKALEEEKAVSESSPSVEKAKEETEAINAKTKARKKSVETIREEQTAARAGGDNEVTKAQQVIEVKEQEAAAIAKVNEERQRETATPPTVKTEDLSPLSKQLDDVNAKIAAKTELFKNENTVVNSVAQSEADALKQVAGAVDSITSAKQASTTTVNTPTLPVQPTENLSPLIGQLDDIITKIREKNEEFKNEATIVSEAAQSEATALRSIAEVLDRIKNSLSDISGKGVKVSITGINGLKNLNDIDFSKMDDRLGKALESLQQFTTKVGELKIDDTSLIASINNLLKDGEKLKTLAEVLKASKREINAASKVVTATKTPTAVKEPTAPKPNIDMSEWREALNQAETYYKLRDKYNKDTISDLEKQKFDEIRGKWADLQGKVTETTKALQEQGRSVELVERFQQMYARGFQNWQAQTAEQAKQSEISALNKFVGSAAVKANEQTGSGLFKYTDELRAKFENLKNQVDAINSKKID